MNVLQKLFGGQPVAAPVQGTPAVPGNLPITNPNPAAPNNPTVPQASVEATDAPPVSPLDQFKTLWEPNANPPAAPKGMFADVTQEGLNTAAKKNDFSKVVTPEMLTAIAGGGEGAVAATLQAMNLMSQKSFGDSAFATTKIVEKALAEQQAQFTAMLPALIKSQSVSENLRNANPIFNHPATAPILDMFKTQALQKFPNASATEIEAMARSYVESFAQAATPAPKQSTTNSKDTDWDSFLA